jgi:O-antigen ligase
MHRLAAFLWMVTIGSNLAGYYSMAAGYSIPYLGAVILFGSAYFLYVLRMHVWTLLAYKDFVFVAFVLIFPVLTYIATERTFERNAYTSVIGVTMVFLTSSLLLLCSDFRRTLKAAAMAIVVIGVVLNLYELLVEANTWSIALGRSAGLYINPNISGSVLLGYGLFYLSTQSGRLTPADFLLMTLLVIGVFTTFSRASILALALLLGAITYIRLQRGDVPRLIGGFFILSVVAGLFIAYVLRNIELSDAAVVRIVSLLTQWGVGDYEQDRMYAINASMELISKSPILGAGPGTMYELPEGPHNMFVAMMLDYGLVGLGLYTAIILRLVWSARRARKQMAWPLWTFVGWMTIFSLVSHNLLDYIAYIPLLGFALVGAYRAQEARRDNTHEAN